MCQDKTRRKRTEGQVLTSQASTAREDRRRYERHASVPPVFRTPFAMPAVLSGAFGDWSSTATAAHMAPALPFEADAGFDAVDWIPASITGGEAGLWRSDWHGPDHGLGMLPCAFW